MTCTLSRLLNILVGGGHIRSRCAVDWLQCVPDLIYTYLCLQHGTAMLCLTADILQGSGLAISCRGKYDPSALNLPDKAGGY